MSQQNPKTKKKSFIYGLIIGGAVGSVLGLLFAPAKGSDTRGQIRQKLKNVFQSPVQHVQNVPHHIPQYQAPYRSDLEISHNRHNEINVLRKVNSGPKELLLKLADWLDK